MILTLARGRIKSCAIRIPQVTVNSLGLRFFSSTQTSPRKSGSIHPAPTSILWQTDNPERAPILPTQLPGIARTNPVCTRALPIDTRPLTIMDGGNMVASDANKSSPADPSVDLLGILASGLMNLICSINLWVSICCAVQWPFEFNATAGNPTRFGRD